MKRFFCCAVALVLVCTAFAPLVATADHPKGYWPYHVAYTEAVEKGDVEKLLKSESVYKCLTCFACVERCPRGVEPAKVIEAVRLEAIRGQGKNHLKPDQIPEMLDEELPQQAIVSALRKYAK